MAGLETAQYVSGLVSTNPATGDNVSQGDDHLRLLKAVLLNTFPDAGKPFRLPKAEGITEDETVAASDQSTVYVVDASGGAVDVALPSGLTSTDAGWAVGVIKNDNSTEVVTITPPSGTLNGEDALTLSYQFDWAVVTWTGSAFVAMARRFEVLDQVKANHCRVVTTGNVTIATALNVGDAVDGVTLVAGDRVLVAQQTTKSQNGVYVAGAAPARAPDYASFDSHVGAVIVVEEGTKFADTVWVGTSDRGGTLDSSDIIFVELETLLTVPLPTGYFRGLELTKNATDPTNDIDIAAGKTRDSTDSINLVLASGLTKRLDSGWVVGTGQGGLDTGSVATDATYYAHLIERSDTRVVDVVFSLSDTAPTLPTGYDYSKLIGKVVRAGGLNVGFLSDLSRGGWRQVATHTFENEANYELKDLGAFTKLRLMLEMVLPATDGQGLRFTASADNGANYVTTYGHALVHYEASDNSGTDHNANSSQAVISKAVGNVANEGVSGRMLLFDFGRTVESRGAIDFTYKTTGSVIGTTRGAIAVYSESILSAFKLAFNSGNIASGRIAVEGYVD
jgi:hypothetical protein